MTIENYRTLTGLTLDKAIEELKKRLPEAAYKPVGGRTYLTDINTAYLIEIANNVFGPCGLGWYYNYNTADMTVLSEMKTGGQKGEYQEWFVGIKKFKLYYRYKHGEEIHISAPIITACGNRNQVREDAMKGAVTNGLGKAFSMLCWQLDIYKGLGKGTQQKKKAELEGEPEEEKGLPDHPYSPEVLKERMQQVAKLAKAKLATGTWQPAHHGAVAGNLELCFAGEKDSKNKRHAITEYWFGWESFNEASEHEISAIKAFLKAAPEYEGGPWLPNKMAIQEVQATVKMLSSAA